VRGVGMALARTLADLHAYAERLYELITCGHNRLRYSVDCTGPQVVEHVGGRMRVLMGRGAGPPWAPARERIVGTLEAERLLNSAIVEKHIRGSYWIAPEAPGNVSWVAIDIDAHVEKGASLVEMIAARADALERLGKVWRALGCNARRQAVIFRSPGGGFHVWIAVTRGETSINPEHTWPAATLRTWFGRHLAEAGLEIRSGSVEVYPAANRLRAPCGRQMVLLQPTNPDDPDNLGLVPWPGTIYERGGREVRDVRATVAAFCDAFEASRRPVAEWLGRPEFAWHPVWGFLGWRNPDEDQDRSPDDGDQPEKTRSQQSAIGPGGSLAAPQGRGGRTRGLDPDRSAGVRGGARDPDAGSDSGPAPDPDLPFDPMTVRGPELRALVNRFLREGVTEAGTRWYAVKMLVFYWGATCGLSDETVLARIEAWCQAHPHTGSREGAKLTATCLAEARGWLRGRPGWKYTGRGRGGMGVLVDADRALLDEVFPAVREEFAEALRWCAGHADEHGEVSEPLEMTTRFLMALFGGERRIAYGGKARVRVTTVVVAELVRLGFFTRHRGHIVGREGRLYSCWYRFGSGVLPRELTIPADTWEAAKPAYLQRRAQRAQARDTGADAAPATSAADEARELAAGAVELVTVRVCAERRVTDGVLYAASDGGRGPYRAILLGADGGEAPDPRAWFARMYRLRASTVGEFLHAEPATTVPFPDLAELRPDLDERRRKRLVFPGERTRLRLTRRERLELGGGAGGATAPPAAGRADPRAELAELGLDRTSELELLPFDVAELAAAAWRGFIRRGT